MNDYGALGDFDDRWSVLNSNEVQLALMTEDQKKIYAYYLAKDAAWQPDGSGNKSIEERKAAADKYYHTIANEISQKLGQAAASANAEKHGGTKLGELASLWEFGLHNAVTNMGSGAAAILGLKNGEKYYAPAYSAVEAAQSETAQRYTGDSTVRRVIADLTMNTANQVPQILTGVLAAVVTGGLSAAGTSVSAAQRAASVVASRWLHKIWDRPEIGSVPNSV